MATECALDQLNAGVILVDAAARMLFANRVAEAILADESGLHVDGDGLCGLDRNTTWILRRLIASCADTMTIAVIPAEAWKPGEKTGGRYV